MKLLGILIGFIIAMLGLIIAIHSTSHVVGLLMLFGGMYLTLRLSTCLWRKVIIMAQQNEEHLEVISKNKAKAYEEQKSMRQELIDWINSCSAMHMQELH
jgi:threonine/homoserine/homoserine lactone efflux protein